MIAAGIGGGLNFRNLIAEQTQDFPSLGLAFHGFVS
jgi:hypothetical protein